MALLLSVNVTDSTRELNEICGSDGLTYATPCLLDYQACRNKVEGNKPVTLLYEGKCAEGKGLIFPIIKDRDSKSFAVF